MYAFDVDVDATARHDATVPRPSVLLFVSVPCVTEPTKGDDDEGGSNST
jgi:hypothetical protein